MGSIFSRGFIFDSLFFSFWEFSSFESEVDSGVFSVFLFNSLEVNGIIGIPLDAIKYKYI